MGFADDQALRDGLREPFPPEQIGHKPRGGTQIDFVGHAAVTDRLNKVVPDWHYTVDAEMAAGEGFVVRGTFTVGGVSRVEYGEGKDPKKAVSDLVKRGAMRFGVALDLWSKEELGWAPDESSGAARDGTAPAPGRAESMPATSPAHVGSGTARENVVGEKAAAEGEEAGSGPTPSGGSDPASDLLTILLQVAGSKIKAVKALSETNEGATFSTRTLEQATVEQIERALTWFEEVPA